MATLATQRIDRDGLTPSYAAATLAGDKFTPTGRTFLHVKNGSGGAITVTVAGQGDVIEDLPVPDKAVSVGAGSEEMIGPFPGSQFGDTADSGLAAITYSGVTTLTIAAIELP